MIRLSPVASVWVLTACLAYWAVLVGATAFGSHAPGTAGLLVPLTLELLGLPLILISMNMVGQAHAAKAAAAASRDELTGLPNRTLFFERLEDASARSLRH